MKPVMVEPAEEGGEVILALAVVLLPLELELGLFGLFGLLRLFVLLEEIRPSSSGPIVQILVSV